ncbi:hypothetical protein [Oceanobacillus bengalensis]|uniref:ATPase n=1 Tax=Oceanobacillus bengalensis TaxID=1435466 RepID=A0A494Z6S2_9BACI|nr:hypothetical protein [Oceanobacillus bengalensis]RKQ18195.1 hypothetical protein D8M05_01975 [Oceanobacillus bengalensis]
MKTYYVSGNTAEGFVTYLDSNVENIKQIIVLKHPSNTLKTTIINRLIVAYKDNEIEVLKSPLSNNYLDGVIIRDKSIAIINNRLSTPDLAGAIELDLSLFIKDKPNVNKEATEKFNLYTEKAYENFKTGLSVHDDLEEIYITEMNFKAADKLADSLIQKLLHNKRKQNRNAFTSHRLFGTNTADGVVNEVPHIIEQIKNVYYIKGRAGTGKSTFMKKVATACTQFGYDVELYHCSFDPNSLDMVIVRDLEFCMFDSTDPHEFFPSREGEEIIDLYEEAVTPGTDEKFEKQINEINNNYKAFMKKGVKDLKEAGIYLEKMEKNVVFTEKETDNITAFIKEQIVQ